MAGCIYLHVWADPPEQRCDKQHDDLDCEICEDYRGFDDVVDEYFGRQLQERRDGE